MTDYERTTTHQSTTVDPAGPTAYDPRRATTTTERTYAPPGPGAATVLAPFVMFLFGVLQVALILRVILLLLVANQGNDVVQLIFNLTDPFVEPFRGMFRLDRVTAGRQVLDIAAIVALIGWTLVEMLVLALVRVFNRRTVTEV
jgi:YggT family protein